MFKKIGFVVTTCSNQIEKKGKKGDFKAPSKIHFLDELPKGPSGKIQRFKIKDLI